MVEGEEIQLEPFYKKYQNYLIIGVVILAFLIIIYFFAKGKSSKTKEKYSTNTKGKSVRSDNQGDFGDESFDLDQAIDEFLEKQERV